jgi:hypothetical protein
VRITLDQLRSLQSPVIDLLEILSLEGQHYMARLSMENQTLLLSEKNGTTSLFRGAWQIQDTLRLPRNGGNGTDRR